MSRDKHAPATGYLWVVHYQQDGEEAETMIVSAITPELALKEANASLSFPIDGVEQCDFWIFGLIRDNMLGALGE